MRYSSSLAFTMAAMLPSAARPLFSLGPVLRRAATRTLHVQPHAVGVRWHSSSRRMSDLLMEAATADGADVAELEAQIKAQGDRVRGI